MERQIRPLAGNESYLVGKIEKAVSCGYFSMPNKKSRNVKSFMMDMKDKYEK